MRSLGPWKAAAVIPGQGNGHGVESGLWSLSPLAADIRVYAETIEMMIDETQ